MIGLIVLGGCNATRPYLAPSEKDWSLHTWNGEISHEVFLVGDAGDPDGDWKVPAVNLMARMAHSAGEDATVLYLGDNIYPAGLPDSLHPDRAAAEKRIRQLVDPLKGFDGRIVFIPGNHDWMDSGPDGLATLKRQEEFVEELIKQKDPFLPENGFPGPEELKLDSGLKLLVIDTEWLITDQDRSFGDTGEYDVETVSDFYQELNRQINDNSDDRLLVIGHHPLYSNGPHAGHFSAKDHLFPLLHFDKSLYIPLPVIGSLYPLTRRYLGSPQDMSHPRYAGMIRAMTRIFSQHESLVYAAGHEHSLQYVEKAGGKQHYIVSGAGSDHAFAQVGNGMNFVYSGEGFTRLVYLKDGSLWMEMWAVDSDSGEGECILRKQLFQPLRERQSVAVDDNIVVPVLADSVEVAANPNYAASGLKKFFIGSGNRKAWVQPVKVPVFDIARVAGGLTPVKQGGGQQTISLRLSAEDGTEYVLRSVDKNPLKSIPEFMRETLAADIVVQQNGAAHPYGAIAVSKLADAAGINHPIPVVYWVPRDPRFGQFEDLVADQLMLFEERPKDDVSEKDYFGNAPEVVSAHSFYDELTSDNDNRVDARFFAKNRLFDMLLADWDRHRDQFRWAEYDRDGGGKLYKPIPRDRDNVFNRYNGLMMNAGKAVVYDLGKMQSFTGSFGYLKGLTRNGHPQDRRLLSSVDRETWISLAQELQQEITDEVVQRAIDSWPDAIARLYRAEISETMRKRKAQLPEIAEKYYELLSHVVDVVGSDKHERFEVHRLDDEKTEVVVYSTKKDGEIKEEYFRRLFFHDETKEIRLYGLDGEDQFIVSGDVNRSLKVIAVGGPGSDYFSDDSHVRGARKMTRFYDSTSGNEWNTGRETRELRSDDPMNNFYDRLGYTHNATLPVIYPGFNREDGVFLGGGMRWIKHGFRADPLARSHTLQANFAARSLAFNVRYEGLFTDFVKDWDLKLETYWHSPNNYRNFYGLGNETPNSESLAEYYEARLRQFRFAPQLEKSVAGGTIHFRTGPFLELNDVREDEGRFLGTPQAGILNDPYKNRVFAGWELAFDVQATDVAHNPKQGFRWIGEADLHIGLTEKDDTHTRLDTDLAMYISPKLDPQLTLALRVGATHLLGDFPFYSAATLGARHNLRGFRSTRFTGRTAFFSNAEARFELFKVSGALLIGKVGGLGFVDVGRVWTDGERSRIWHPGYGGGLWLDLFDFLLLSGSVGYSAENNAYATVGAGFQF